MAIEFIVKYPLLSVILLSLLMTFITTIIYKYTTDQTKLKSYREELKNIKKQMNESKQDLSKLNDLQKRSMEISMDQLKHSLKPMIITFVPAILIFALIKDSLPITQVILNMPFDIPKMGDNEGFGWFGVYLVTSFAFSSLLRKFLKVY
ncbi:MAG: EMC3/TMCO1 family protein [Nanoarchaeota archaeon]